MPKHSAWITHDGGPKPIDDTVPFRPRIRAATRDYAERKEFTTSREWRWLWSPGSQNPGDIVEYQTEGVGDG